MGTRFRRKDLKHDEIAEAAFDIGHWIEAHWKVLAGWGAAIVVAALLITGFFWMNSRKHAEAELLLAAAQQLFSDAQDADSATDTDRSAVLSAFDAVIEHSGSSNPGLSALYYKAATLGQLGRTDEAIVCLKELTGSRDAPSTLRGPSDLLMASLLSRSGKSADAVEFLNATMADENAALAPEQALLEIGRIHREQGDIEQAHAAWQRVVNEYGETTAANEARQLLGPGAVG